METRCYYCEETEKLDTCRRCMKPVCPQHRWGTGDLSDGYYCLSTRNECGGSAALEHLIGATPFAPRKPTIYQRFNALSPLALLGVSVLMGLVFSVLSTLFEIYIRSH